MIKGEDWGSYYRINSAPMCGKEVDNEVQDTGEYNNYSDNHCPGSRGDDGLVHRQRRFPEASFTAGTVEIRAGQTVKAGEGIIDFHDYLNKAAEENEIVEIYAKQGPAGALRKTESIRMIR